MRACGIIFSALLLAACGQKIDNSRLRVDVIEDSPRLIAVGRLPLSPASAYVRQATAQGLVTFDARGQIVPALAARWIVTDDGLSYIFRLNKTRWNDAREIRSDEVGAELSARLRELRNSRLGPEISVIENVVPMTGKVIEIRLKAPMPNLLELLAQPELGLISRGAGSGPMRSRSVDNALELRRRIADPAGPIKLEDDRLTLTNNDPSTALARYRLGLTDLVLGGRFEHWPMVSALNDDEAVMIDSAPGLFGLLIVSDGAFLSQQENREAIASAIDRPRLLASFEMNDWREALTIVPENTRNRTNVERPSWTKQNIKDRREQARNIITRWKAGNASVRPLKLALPRGTGARILFARLRSDFAAIGLELESVPLGQQADMRLIDEVAVMSTSAWYLGQLSCTTTPICDLDVDRQVALAMLNPDREARALSLGEAEAKLQAKRNFIPIANPVRWSIAREGLLGYSPNTRGLHALSYLGRDTK